MERQVIAGARMIPHGIDEMALDTYLHGAGWERLKPYALFEV
jgi:hypothetical protein